jgi:hypothetical protein
VKYDQSQRIQYPTSHGVGFDTRFMDVSINFYNQICTMAIKIHDESSNDMLSPKMQSQQLISSQPCPEKLLGGCHGLPEIF